MGNLKDNSSAQTEQAEKRVFDPDGDGPQVTMKIRYIPHLTSRKHCIEWGLQLSICTWQAPHQETHMRVSSKHLSLASVVFKQMLQGKFWESATLQSTGCVEIPLPDNNPEALAILLNICHVQMSNVPRTVSQRTMAQIACLVNKYYFHEVILPFLDVWVDSMKPDNIGCLTSSALVELMAIYCCFNRPDELRGITQEAIVSLYAINKQREGTILLISTLVQERLKKYTKPQLLFNSRPKVICDFDCDCAQLGALVKVLTSLTFLELLMSLFIGYSINRLSHGLKNMKVPWCHYRASQGHLPGAFESAITELEGKITPPHLNISDSS
ncbi:hypothetical protein CIRG_02155 [Coccidioides immitis RMSCC 2394]|uniref:Uncharacterized protein n=1 Tax=Coccidioides immitis RMSCC 2394 TaxID=404692 RepID=A0A0J6Y098_COCIT|nr:hypothetical protein CIRG_02155 [Coccidioides immitis RMSCC 2394]